MAAPAPVSTAVDVAILGYGLVSPIGLTSQEHVFFIRAGEPSPSASPFRTAAGELVRVAYCPLLGAREAVPSRCIKMASWALHEALGSLERLPKRVALSLVTPTDRPGFTSADRDAIEKAILHRTGLESLGRAHDACGAFLGLADLAGRVAADELDLGIAVAVDSYIDLSAIESIVAYGRHPWQPAVELPSEGAAAVVLASPRVVGAIARGKRAAPARLRAVITQPGASHDHNDVPVDGVAMTEALRMLPSTQPIGTVAGQLHVDPLRSQEWSYALARNATRFIDAHDALTLEEDVGRLGAAAGAMSLVYGLARRRARITRVPPGQRAPLLAWAIAPDGLRGLALAEPSHA